MKLETVEMLLLNVNNNFVHIVILVLYFRLLVIYIPIFVDLSMVALLATSERERSTGI